MPFISGTAYWAKVYENQKDTKYNEHGVYSIDVAITPDTAKKLEKDHITVKYTEEGPRITLKRKHALVSGKTGEVVFLGPPQIVGPDGVTPFTDKIGNGSEVTVRFTSTEFKGKRYPKMDALQVVKHVPYDGMSFPDTTKSEADDADDNEEKVA